MDIKKLKNPLENPEVHHKILLFWLTMIISVLITRLIVFVHNPNPVFFNFELHHFDYGIMCLLLNTFFMIFGIKHDSLHITLAGFATGMIVDDYWFIRKSVVENDAIQTQLYNATLPAAIIFASLATFCILFISARKNKKIRAFTEAMKKQFITGIDKGFTSNAKVTVNISEEQKSTNNVE